MVLTVFRASTGETLEIPVTRARITEHELQSELLDNGIGYIRISRVVDPQTTRAIADCFVETALGAASDLGASAAG